MKPTKNNRLIAKALEAARDTRYLLVEPGARHRAGEVFSRLFGSRKALVVADENTFEAAGRDVSDSLIRGSVECDPPHILPRDVYADYAAVEKLVPLFTASEAVPLAVGAGTVNDLVKLAAFKAGKPYMVAATAASVDGYTAFGASIMYRDMKQTLDCPAPSAVLADLDVIAAAPRGMNSAGYADLLAKIAAGADWILAEAAGEEPVDPAVWSASQDLLRTWVADPEGVLRGDPAPLRGLVEGLMIAGFAMQAYLTSRPAAGAEHQFSHLWDMQHHRYNNAIPSHGFKVGIGTLSSLALFEDLLKPDKGDFDIPRALHEWPTLEDLDRRIETSFGFGEMTESSKIEVRAKYLPRENLRDQLTRLQGGWTDLRGKLGTYLSGFGSSETRDMLIAAGCPSEPEGIGISRERLRRSFEDAYLIRRRYTVLDFVERWGIAGSCLGRLFGPRGPWPLG
jgi:glycerol-1-phosphate dehydrogenase [NAD(P)+]